MSAVTPERLDALRKLLDGVRLSRVMGSVVAVTGAVVNASVPDAFMGEICEIHPRHGEGLVRAEVVGFREGHALLMPLGEVRSVGLGSEVTTTGSYLKAPVGDQLLGRVLDGLGEPIDGRPLKVDQYEPVYRDSPDPILRERIRTQMPLGIKAIDALFPCGEGQRVGIFAAAGGGKSTLLGMIARYAQADVKVVVLVGERGREVEEFIEDSLGEGLERSVVVVATADKPAVVRLKAAYMGTTIAEYFRDRGKKVILMMDSVTRFARAQREIGLARGEPAARYGFPPSVFAEMPRLFERCGNSAGGGSMTGFYTVLVEGDNLQEPVSDETKSLLDGHIYLSPKVGYRPAIDVLESESRVKGSLRISPDATDAAEKVSAFLRQYKKDEQDIEFGFFEGGVKAKADERKGQKTKVDNFLSQHKDSREELARTVDGLRALAASLPEFRRAGEVRRS
jgi:FliI/YscN family ATPase